MDLKYVMRVTSVSEAERLEKILKALPIKLAPATTVYSQFASNLDQVSIYPAQNEKIGSMDFAGDEHDLVKVLYVNMPPDQNETLIRFKHPEFGEIDVSLHYTYEDVTPEKVLLKKD